MAVQGATQTVIDWIFSTGFDDMPAEIRRQAVLSLYDGVGANLACSLLPVAHRTVDFIKLVGGPAGLYCHRISRPFLGAQRRPGQWHPRPRRRGGRH